MTRTMELTSLQALFGAADPEVLAELLEDPQDVVVVAGDPQLDEFLELRCQCY